MARYCDHCGSEVRKQPNALNRADAIGAKLYCDRKCAGLARRNGKTPAQRKAEKAAYDAMRRVELADQIKSGKRAWYIANRERMLAEFAARRAQPGYQERHNEYCRQPEYRAYKFQYDRTRRARKQFGDSFADAFLLLQDVEREIDERASRYDIYMANGTINKAQARRRAL